MFWQLPVIFNLLGIIYFLYTVLGGIGHLVNKAAKVFKM